MTASVSFGASSVVPSSSRSVAPGAGTMVTALPTRRSVPARGGTCAAGSTIGSAGSAPNGVSPSLMAQMPVIGSTYDRFARCSSRHASYSF
jgi:hypothetical protein